MQNYLFLSYCHKPPHVLSFVRKKVRENTFRAFTGKLDKPIESKIHWKQREFRRLDSAHVTESWAGSKEGICCRLSNYEEERSTWRCATIYRGKGLHGNDHTRSWKYEFARQDYETRSVCQSTITCSYCVFTLFAFILFAIDVPVSFKSGTTTKPAENSSRVCDAIYCLQGALALWPLFCQTFWSTLQSF